ncbi:MAG: hypothetical protein PHN18_06025 [Sulfurospirillaceae bacterium]|jgi:hypothetical protein|nr:hypothetical protein [Sulfurospirillaceae bacterium]MDD2825870.1 hypothetical protein [Sulfurospirillaceae bacterium]
MSGITFSKINLANLIDHHIALLERFGLKEESPFSLIFFTLEDKKEIDALEIFQRILRRTDALFNHVNHYVVMLTGTDWNGATELLSGIQDFLDQEAQDNIVTYPDDGENSETLIRKLREIVEDNTNVTSELLM